MNSLPLHPAIVHLPLGLAFLMPLFAVGLGWALWTSRVPVRSWVAIVALQGLLLGAGLVATNTGEREEDVVESVVPRGALHQHEEYAEQFVWGSAVTLALAAVVLLTGRRVRLSRTLVAATVVGTVVVAGLGVRVGHAGGRLVYEHGAAGAYAVPASVATAPLPGEAPTEHRPSVTAASTLSGR